MLPRLEPRREPARGVVWLTPLIAVALTVATGFVLFTLMGYDPFAALYHFFVSPVLSIYGLAELAIKATPLVLIAVGLAIGFRAGVWNIGAEGQLTVGAIAGGGLALWAGEHEGGWVLPAMCCAGILGGMAYAAIPAFLKTRFEVNEILTSLMLTYVATLFLSLLVYGPWKDPDGYGFPESRMFSPSATLPVLLSGTRLHIGAVIALLVALSGWVLMSRTIIGFEVKVVGQALAAARFAGFSRTRMIWFCLLLSGGVAGLAGLFEVAGPIGQLVPVISPGYGFTAIIVAFLGRLHPFGVLIAGLVMALSYLGGENVQITVGLPQAVTGVFQGMLLFFLLACDVLIRYRIRFGAARQPVAREIRRGGARRMNVDAGVLILVTVIGAATPLLLAALGELVVEKSGVLNLGVEGMMLAGAVTAFATAITTGSSGLGIVTGALAGAALALIFAVLTMSLLANQVATGLALTIFGIGLSALIGSGFVGTPAERLPRLAIPGLSDLPVIGPLLFRHDFLVYFSLFMTAAVGWFLTRTRSGMIVRAIGESHEAAHSIGYPVIRIRYLTILFGGVMGGLGGAFLSLSYTPMWVEEMTAGRGWIALALVVFSAWRPWRLLLGAYLFGGVTILQLYAQGSGLFHLPAQLLSMLPYLMTILVLTIISAGPWKGRLNAPACLGRPFHPTV